MARRAGHVVIGSRAVRKAAAAGRLHAVIVARDATENARSRLSAVLRDPGFPSVRNGAKAELGDAVGRSPVAAVGITDAGLAARIVAGLPAAVPKEQEKADRDDPKRKLAEGR